MKKRCNNSSLVVLGLIAPVFWVAAASAQPTPSGPEFTVNTFSVDDQKSPAVASTPDGNFLVVWESFDQTGGFDNDIFGQIFDPLGLAVGTEFRVNSYTVDEQQAPAVAAGGNNSFVVVWESFDQNGSFDYDVFGQRLSSQGTFVGGEFLVNAYTTDDQQAPAVAAAADGSFVVAWESSGQEGGLDYGVFARRFNSSGGALGSDFRANTYTSGDQRSPSLGTAGDGSFVVVWQSDGQDGSFGYGVFGQRFSGAGAAVGGEFQVNSYTSDDQQAPAITVADDGSFVVVWESSGQEGGVNYGVFGQRFAASGSANGTEFAINTYTSGDQQDPSVANTADGGFIVAWTSMVQDGGVDAGVFAQQFDTSGAVVGSEFEVNQFTTDAQERPSIAALPQGGFVVAWESSGQEGGIDYGVVARQYSGSATMCGDATGDGRITATDALAVLNVAVGSLTCDLCICDVDQSGRTSATDALALLQSAVGQPIVLTCVAC